MIRIRKLFLVVLILLFITSTTQTKAQASNKTVGTPLEENRLVVFEGFMTT